MYRPASHKFCSTAAREMSIWQSWPTDHYLQFLPVVNERSTVLDWAVQWSQCSALRSLQRQPCKYEQNKSRWRIWLTNQSPQASYLKAILFTMLWILHLRALSAVDQQCTSASRSYDLRYVSFEVPASTFHYALVAFKLTAQSSSGQSGSKKGRGGLLQSCYWAGLRYRIGRRTASNTSKRKVEREFKRWSYYHVCGWMLWRG